MQELQSNFKSKTYIYRNTTRKREGADKLFQITTENIKINIRHQTTGQESSENIKQDKYIYKKL